MADAIVLNKTNPLLPAEDFQALRRQGIEQIEKLGSNSWNEYNASDPGITILEAVCYAITDLAYRTGFDMKDLLAPQQLNNDTWDKVFYTARQILHNSPLTINDYRKLIVDVDGIRNAWIEISKDYEVPMYVDYTFEQKDDQGILIENPCDKGKTCQGRLEIDPNAPSSKIVELNGLYNVIIEFEDNITEEQEREEARSQVLKRLYRNRNLCEDFLSVISADYEDFTLDGAFVLSEDADPDEVLAKIFFTVYQYFMPGLRFYTIDQLMEKGWTVDEIFEGPPLKHGFILDDELEKTDLFRDMHLSDLINAIADIPGIRAITYLHLPAPEGGVAYFDTWIKALQDQRKVARLDAVNSSAVFCKEREIITYNKGAEKDRRMNGVLHRFRDWQARERHYKLKGHQKDFAVPEGEFMDVEDYFPVQYSLPHCYHVGNLDILDGLPKTLPDIQIMQLRGYLLFFEQILVNYHSQLGNLRALFSFDEEVDKTYYSNLLLQINNMAELLLVNADLFQALEEGGDANVIVPQIEQHTNDFVHTLHSLVESPGVFRQRRNQILNHLMARFAEERNEYEHVSALVCPEHAEQRFIAEKTRLLADYPNISNRRSIGFDYTQDKEIWDTLNISGPERRIGRILGFENVERRFLAPGFVQLQPVMEKKPDGTLVQKQNLKGKKLFIVVVTNPDDEEDIWLTSREVAGKCCAEDFMNLLLERAGERRYYRFKEVTRKRNQRGSAASGDYWFELLEQDEETLIATGRHFKTPAERESAFDKIVDAVEQIHRNQGLHLVEHILLRPKLDEVIPVFDQNSDGNPDNDPPLPVSLLNICLDPCDIPPQSKSTSKEPSYRVHVSRLPAELCYNGEPWVLRLHKYDDTNKQWKDILYKKAATDEETRLEYLTFKRYEYMIKHLQLLRQYGGVEDNYVVRRNENDQWGFIIYGGDPRKALAQSSFTYRTKTEASNELKNLIKYLSFQFDLYGCEERCDHNEDPYSFRTTVVLPCWLKCFRDETLRNLVEKTIRLELPAHISPRIYWIGIEEMRRFEKAYSEWLAEMANHLIPEYEPVNTLVELLNTLRECGCCEENCKE